MGEDYSVEVTIMSATAIPATPAAATANVDPFDEVLGLEDHFYDEGFRQGEADGTRAGKAEGRTFGLENGFGKFLESGRLQGRAAIWANQLYPASKGDESTAQVCSAAPLPAVPTLPPLPRLQKNLRALYALVEPGTLSTANTDEAVADFDDRIKRAQSKARIFEKMAGELVIAPATYTATPPQPGNASLSGRRLDGTQ